METNLVEGYDYLFDNISEIKSWNDLDAFIRSFIKTMGEETRKGVPASTGLIVLRIITTQLCMGDTIDINIVISRIVHEWKTVVRPLFIEYKGVPNGQQH